MKSCTRIAQLLLTVVILDLMIVPQTFAQTSASEDSSAGTLLEEIIVTARRREQNIQDVSVSITAISGDMLENLGFQDLTQVIAQAPNVEFAEGYTPLIIVRGQSNLTGDIGSSETPVGVYVDDIYRAQLAGRWAQLFDLERVEFLRGPQGTLFGRNTTAGVVNYISRTPTEAFEGYINAQYGSYETRIIDGAISGPISDRVRGRLAFKYHEDNGWMTNTNPDPALFGDKFGVTDAIAARGIVEFDLSDDAMLSLNVAHTRQRNTTKLFTFRGLLDPVDGSPCPPATANAGLCASFLGFVNEFPEDPEFGRTNHTPDELPENLDITTAIARLNWKLNDDVNLVSITAFETVERFYRTDDDVGSDGLLGIFQFHSVSIADSEAFSQEIRIEGTRDTANWVAGVYFYDEEVSPFTVAYPDLGVPAGMIDALSTTGVTSWALFGQVDVEIVDSLNLIVGVRYTEDDRTANVDTGGSFTGGARVQGDFDLNANETIGRIGLDWRPRDGLLAYASIASGFKSGQFNVTGLDGDLSLVTPTDTENDTAYEVGWKWDFWDGRARWNTALWYTEVTDLQGSIFEFNPVTLAPQNRFTNFGNADIYGLETELVLQATDNLEVSLGLGLTESEINAPLSITSSTGGGNFDPVTFEPPQEPLNGHRMPNYSGVNVNGIVRYQIPMNSAGKIVLQADGRWKSNAFNSTVENPYAEIPENGVLNLRAFWTSQEGRFNASVFIENVTDEERVIDPYVIDGLDWVETVLDKPLTWGVKFGLSF